MSSKVFQGYRALGFVSNHIPLCVRYVQRRREHMIVTVVDKSFHTYGSDHLMLLSVSSTHSGDILCVACDTFLVFTACENIIYAWRRGTELQGTYEGHKKNVHILLPFGPHLLSVDTGNELKIWDIKSKEILLEMTFNSDTFEVTTMMHPSTYLNKILFGSSHGSLQLWNIRTLNLIYTFKGWGSSVTVLEQAPALDVVAIGLVSGEIILHNLKMDETVMKFNQEWGPVLGLSFRTDNHPYMVSSSPSGHIAIWNLEKRKLQAQMREAHKGAVTGLKFLQNEPLLLSSSSDNSLKMWIFDQSDGSGRLLRIREGHGSPPTKIRFHGLNGVHILSSGLDSTLRAFSTVGDNLNKNLGQASSNRKLAIKKGIKNDNFKLPPITDFTSELSCEKEWDNIAACHRNHDTVTTWSFDHCRMGDHKLLHPRFFGERNVVALCITLSACGNFVVIGYNTGYVDKYNIQSGIHRGTYQQINGEKSNDLNNISNKAHNGAVRGVAVDGLSQITITGGSDKFIRFWKFKSCTFLKEINLESSLASLLLHRESGMLAVALDSQAILIVDYETKNIVRKFTEHQSRITDMVFSPDSRWLLTASMDNLIRIWDLPSGRLIDCFMVPTPCTSMTISATGEYLATTHANDVGIYLWSNISLYSHISLNPLPDDYQPKMIDLPKVSLPGVSSVQSETKDTEDDVEEFLEVFKSSEQISDELVTLSLLPHSHWKNLLNLDVIKERNKPLKVKETPKLAPFFIPTIAGLEPKFGIEDEQQKRLIDNSDSRNLFGVSPFGKMLLKCDAEDNYGPILLKLKELGPSAIDVELRTLSPYSGGSEELMAAFLKALEHGMKSNKDFELIQAYLGLFLKLHSDVIIESDFLKPYLETISQCQEKCWPLFQSKMNQSLCLINFFRSSVI